jgi:hypothetical protein
MTAQIMENVTQTTVIALVKKDGEVMIAVLENARIIVKGMVYVSMEIASVSTLGLDLIVQ